MLSETEVFVHLSYSSLNPERSQFIDLKLIRPSCGTFQNHQKLTSADINAPAFATNFECVLKTSLIGFESRFFSAACSLGVLVERPRSLEQKSAPAVDCLLVNKSELSHLNDGTATVRVLHYTQYIAS